MAFVNINGGNTNYIAGNSLGSAKGKTILFVHGAWANLKMWLPQIDFFSRNHTPIAVDLPTHGDSGGKPAEDMSAFRKFMKAFADELGLKRFIYCGHSMGSTIGLDFALHYPERIEALVMVDGAVQYGGGSNEILQLMERDPEQGLLEMRKVMGRVRNAAAEESSGPLTEKERAFATLAYNDMKALRQFGDFTPLLGKIKIPTIILLGEDDVSGAKDLTPKFLAIPGSRMEIIPKAGHVPSIDNPEAVNAAIDRLIRSLGT